MQNKSTGSEGGFGEPEQDANAALTELDKGLRSLKIGEQCEAIVRFPKLFEKYPFPVLINSAMLKLAEVFRTGSNFLRLWVLRVCQQSEKHLDKILNVDEFVKRIFTVIHSNDPLARALTLRTMGSIACIISEKKTVHHSIRNSLDSHDAVELEAAIFAVAKFTAKSKTFSSSICSKISHMIEGLATPVDIKLKLVPVLQYMHHEAVTAATVRELCTRLLSNYPASDFVIIIIRTLTKLAATTLVELPFQLELLLIYLNDERSAVQCVALSCLAFLGREENGAHLWRQAHVEKLLGFILQTNNHKYKAKALAVLCSLVQGGASTAFAWVQGKETKDGIRKKISSSGSPLQLVWSECCYSDNIPVAVQAVQLLVLVAHYARQNGTGIELSQEAGMAVDCLLQLLSLTPGSSSHLKLTLKSTTLLNQASEVSESLVESLCRLLSCSSNVTGSLICEALAAMAEVSPAILLPILPNLVDHLGQLAHDSKLPDESTNTAVLLCLLIFQVHTTFVWSKETMDCVVHAANLANPWAAYKIARAASRYGHHKLAAKLLAHTAVSTSSEQTRFWLQGIQKFASAESLLLEDSPLISTPLLQRLQNAASLYTAGCSHIQACNSPNTSLFFQTEYGRLRADFLKAITQLILAMKTLQTAPPPAIAHAVAVAARDDLQRCGRITQQLRKCVKELRNVAESYGKLYQSAFDADPDSLINLQAQQQSCLLLAHGLELTALKSPQQGTFAEDDVFTLGFPVPLSECSLPLRIYATKCQEAASILQNLAQRDLKPISHLHVEGIMDAVSTIISCPMGHPRFFFQTLQTTSIKLAVSPQSRMGGDPVIVPAGAHFVLKVEGIVQASSLSKSKKPCPPKFRTVKAVTISVSTQLQSGASIPYGPDGKPIDMGTLALSQTAEPHNDYFSAQFLIHFPVGGQHTVSIDTALIDNTDSLWKMGPKAQLVVKSFDEPSTAKLPSRTQPSASTSRVQ